MNEIYLLHFLCDIQFQIGVMRLESGKLKVIRGTRVALTVVATATARDILPLAVEKLRACDSSLPRTTYKLLYPDGKLVEHVPLSNETFTLQGYKAFMGRPYLKLVLYICPEEDYFAGILS
jgi:hypothetical protein